MIHPENQFQILYLLKDELLVIMGGLIVFQAIVHGMNYSEPQNFLGVGGKYIYGKHVNCPLSNPI